MSLYSFCKCVCRIGTPIRVARKVMDRSPHSLLVGDGAAIFAREQGFSIEPNESMLSVHSTKAYEVTNLQVTTHQ